MNKGTERRLQNRIIGYHSSLCPHRTGTGKEESSCPTPTRPYRKNCSATSIT